MYENNDGRYNGYGQGSQYDPQYNAQYNTPYDQGQYDPNYQYSQQQYGQYDPYNQYGAYPQYGQPAVSYGQYLSRTFGWMAGGLLATFAVAFATAYTPLIYAVAPLYLVFTIAELALVLVLSARIDKMQVGTARVMFLAYSVLNGLMLSCYFWIFDLASLVMAFLASAVYFGIMAVYGARTERDLSGWGPKLSMALIALLVCGVFGMLLGMGFVMSLVYSGVGLAVFMLLTAYDTQKLQHWYSAFSGQGDLLEKSAIYGALSLYLDFINIFLRVVRLFGRRRN